jgi:hypothetical protein
LLPAFVRWRFKHAPRPEEGSLDWLIDIIPTCVTVTPSEGRPGKTREKVPKGHTAHSQFSNSADVLRFIKTYRFLFSLPLMAF